MTERETFVIRHSNPHWRAVVERAIGALRQWAERGEMEIRLSEIVRSLDQNAAMWPALTDFAKQVPLVITRRDGSTRTATAYDWKDVLTAAFEEETEWAPGLRSGAVMLGARTSNYGKRKMGMFLTFIRAEGNDRGVVWSEKANDKFAEYIDSRRAA